MRCFNQTIALFQLDHRIVSIYHSYSFFIYNPLPRLEFLKKIKSFNIYRFNNILYYIIWCTSRDTLCLALWMHIIWLGVIMYLILSLIGLVVCGSLNEHTLGHFVVHYVLSIANL